MPAEFPHVSIDSSCKECNKSSATSPSAVERRSTTINARAHPPFPTPHSPPPDFSACDILTGID